MASAKQTKRKQLEEYLGARNPLRVAEGEWRELSEILAPISGRYLRELLRSTGVPLAPLVEGIRQDSFEQLERTLLAVRNEYSSAQAAHDRAHMMDCRRAVIEAKSHARLAMRRAGASRQKRADKEEMIHWMLVWLENPEIFPRWVELRKRAAGAIPPLKVTEIR